MIERSIKETVQPEQALRPGRKRVYSPKLPREAEPLMWVRNFQVTYEMLLQIPDIENWPNHLIGTRNRSNTVVLQQPAERIFDNLDACLMIKDPIGIVVYESGERVYENGKKGQPPHLHRKPRPGNSQ